MLSVGFVLRAVISGLLVAIIAFLARKSPGMGGMVASIPLVSTIAMIWLWNDSQDRVLVADYAQSTFIFFLPSIPMFLIIPWLLRQGHSFWLALAIGLGVTMILYAITARIASAYGITL